MDRFKRIIEGGYQGFQTGDAKQIIRDSAEVSHYVESKMGHFAYVQQLMNDKIIDEAMGRVKNNGDFEYDGDGGFSYRPGVYHNTQYPRQIIAEEYPSQRVYSRPDNVMTRLEAMEHELKGLRQENAELKRKYDALK